MDVDTPGSATWTAAIATDSRSRLGEGPWWDADRERLIWTDIDAGAVHAVEADGHVMTAAIGHPVGFVVGRTGGGFVAGTGIGLLGLDADLRPTEHLANPPDLDDRRRLNDGVCDPAGRVLCGSVSSAPGVLGTLWRWTPREGFTALLEGVGMSNGLAFSPDGRRLYYVDTATRRIDRIAYDAAVGEIGERTVFHEVDESDGLPDGLAVDAAGCVWVAIWGAGEVRRLGPDGDRIGSVRVAASRSSCCAFGGRERDRLFVTTAAEGGEDGAADPAGAPGALFVADVGVRGAPVFEALV